MHKQNSHNRKKSIRGKYSKYIKLGDKFYRQSNLQKAHEAYDQACKVCEEALQKNKTEELYIKWGSALLRKKEFDKAIEKFQRANELNPKNVEAICNWGNALIEQNKDQEAERKIREAIKIDPKYVIAYRRLSFIFVKQGRIEKAIKACKKGIKIDPNNSILYYNLADCLAEYGNTKRAIKMYKKFICLNPNLGDAMINLGCVLERQGKISEAIKWYARAVKVQPGFDIFFGVWERALIKQGRTIESIIVSCHKDPRKFKSPKTYCDLGNELIKSKFYDKAISLFAKSVKVKPNFTRAYIGLAKAYLHQNKYKEAGTALKFAEKCKEAVLQRVTKCEEAVLDMNMDKDKEIQDIKQIRRDLKFGFDLQKTDCISDSESNQDCSLESSQGNQSISLFEDTLPNTRRSQGQEKIIFKNITDTKMKPKDYHAYCDLGCTFFGKGNYEKAKKYFKEAINLHAYCLKAINLWAVIEYYQGNYDEAISIYNSGVVIFPSLYKNLYHTCGKIFKIQSIDKESVRKFRDDVFKNIDQIDFLKDSKGSTPYSKIPRKYKEAVSRHCQTRNLPFNDKLHFYIYLALIWLQKNREKTILANKKPTDDLQRNLILNTQIHCACICHRNRDEYKKAKSDIYVAFKEVMSIKRNFIEALSNEEAKDDSQIYRKWGDALAALQKHDEAIKKYKEAEKIARKEFQIRFETSKSRENEERYSEAKLEYHKAVNINFGLCETYIGWINVLCRQAKYKEAKVQVNNFEKILQDLEEENSCLTETIKAVALKYQEILQNMKLMLDKNTSKENMLKAQVENQKLIPNAQYNYNYYEHNLFSQETLKDVLKTPEGSCLKESQSMLSGYKGPKSLFNKSEAKISRKPLKELKESNTNLGENSKLNFNKNLINNTFDGLQENHWDNSDRYCNKVILRKEDSESYQENNEASKTQGNAFNEKLCEDADKNMLSEIEKTQSDLLRDEESRISQFSNSNSNVGFFNRQFREEGSQFVKQKMTEDEMASIQKLLTIAGPNCHQLITHALGSEEWLRLYRHRLNDFKTKNLELNLQ